MTKYILVLLATTLVGCASNPIVVTQKFPTPPGILMKDPIPLKKLEQTD